MLAIVLVIVLIGLLILRPFLYWLRKGVKYDGGSSIFGTISANVLQRQPMADLLNNAYKKFRDEPYFGIYTFATPALVIRDPELIKDMTVKHFETFNTHKLFSSGEKSHVFSKNLFSTTPEIWRITRPVLSPAFTGSKMRMMYASVDACAQQWFKSIKDKAEDVLVVDIKADIINRFTIDVIATCVFGLQSNSFKDKDNEFHERAVKVSDFGGNRIFALFGYCLKNFIVRLFDLRVVPTEDQKFFTQVVMDTIRLRDEKGIVRADMVNLLMEARKGNLNHDEDDSLNDTGFATIDESAQGRSGKSSTEMSDDEIVGHSLLFLIAGSDTAACGLTFLCYELALHQDIQRRLIEEVDEFMHKKNGKIGYEDLLKMKYLDMVCSESLRKWPPLPMTDRCTTKPHRVGGKFELETGSVIWIPIFAIHRDAKYYEDPEKFDPERFNDENKGKIRKETYMPFGTGPRACIGSRLAMLMFKSITVHILYNFEIVPIEGTPIPLKLSKRHIFLNAEKPVVLGLKKRHTTVNDSRRFRAE